MFRTLIASTALAGALALGAHAQDAQAPADPIMPAPEAGGMDAPAPALEDPAAPADETFVEDWSAVGLETVTAEDLEGAEIRTTMDEEQIGTVGEVVLAADGSTVDGIVAEFGGFLGFGRDRVMIPASDIEVFEDADGNVLVRTSLTRESLEQLPAFEG
jgi:sporulation protein YlmC with PRC-barrel domain